MPIDKDIFDKSLRATDLVLAFLQERKEEGKGYSTREIADAIDISKNHVEVAVVVLALRGKIEDLIFEGTRYYRYV